MLSVTSILFILSREINALCSCDTNAFNASGNTTEAHQAVLAAVLEYFAAGVIDRSAKVYQTSLPPIYFQHPGRRRRCVIIGISLI